MGLHFDAALTPESLDQAPISRRRAVLRWVWRHPRASGYLLLAVLLCAMVAQVASRGTTWEPSTKGLPPNQAGYLWCCGATDVAATWEVPRVVPASVVAAEGVWIGLQTNSGDFFLQVGTQDNQSNFGATYEGFWSDGPLNGAPVDLGNVNPGDVVRARLVLSGSTQWAITFSDQTQHWSHTRQLDYATPYAHALAEWVEEDPAEVVPYQKARLFEMAKTGGTLMHGLEVNGGAPGTDHVQPESFVDQSGTTFSPSPLTHDTFHFNPW